VVISYDPSTDTCPPAPPAVTPPPATPPPATPIAVNPSFTG